MRSSPPLLSTPRQRIRLKERRAVLHKPHPRPEMVKGSVESARDFLRSIGIEPEQEKER